MEAVFLKLVNMSVTAGWLILAVIVLRPLLRKAPKWVRCALWGLAGIRLVCPFSLESVVSLIPSAEPLPPDIIYTATPEIHSGLPILNNIVNPVLSESLAPAPGASANPTQIWSFLFSVVWLVGVAALLLYAVISYLRLRHRVAMSAPLQGNVWICDSIDTPFLLGFFRPRIYLPSTMGEGERTHVIAHERAHMKRHDHWWKPLGFVILAVYWFNPLVWVAYVLLCRDIELACDEKVVRELSMEDKKAYSEALLTCSVPRRMIAACPLAFGEVGVKARIKSVLNYKKPAFWVMVVAILACIVLAVCFLTNPKGDSSNGDGPFGHSYQVDHILYEDMIMLEVETHSVPENKLLHLQCAVSSDGSFYVNGEWLSGEVREVTLKKNNFDSYFIENSNISNVKELARSLRRENDRAWRLDTEYGLYYLLQQKDGTMYLAYAYDHPDAKPAPQPIVCWLARLGKSPREEVESNTAVPFPSGGGTLGYVSDDCLYMTPFSSYLPFEGDSGEYYLITENSFTAVHRETGSVTLHAKTDWNWQEFPWTDEEWNSFYVINGPEHISALYHEMLYLPLTDQDCLLRMDGELWLAHFGRHPSGEPYLWSIYRLVLSSSNGSAWWDLMMAVSSSSQYPAAFAFAFDMEYTSIHAFCTDGNLIGFDDHDGNSYPKGQELSFPAGSNLYWLPTDDDFKTVSQAKITFSVCNGDDMVCAGTIYITGEKSENEVLAHLYTATIVGTGLQIAQNQAHPGAGAVISLAS